MVDDFRRFEEMMNRMFEEFWGRPGRRLLLPPGEKGEPLPTEYRQPFIVLEIKMPKTEIKKKKPLKVE